MIDFPRRSLLAFLLALTCASLAAERATAARKKAAPKKAPVQAEKPVELQALEIRASLHEPSLIYILDQPTLEIDAVEKTPDFTGKIAAPIDGNEL